jgi:hypothetical protein
MLNSYIENRLDFKNNEMIEEDRKFMFMSS